MPDPVQLGPITVVVEEERSIVQTTLEVSEVVAEADRNKITIIEDTPNTVFIGLEPASSNRREQVISFNRSNLLEPTEGMARFFFPEPAVLVEITAGVATAPEGADIILDANVNDVSIFDPDDRPRILEGEVLAPEATDFLDAIVDEGDYMTIDIDQVGSITPGDYLTVTVVYRLT